MVADAADADAVDAEAYDADAFDAYEIAAWDDRAAEYARHFVPITTRIIESLLDAARVGPGKRVLDACSGPGQLAAACAARGATAVGIDISPEMVALARERHPGVEYRQGDVHNLPIADGSMDAVVGNLAILHFSRPEQGAAELVRVLAPGGVVALSTWDIPARNRIVGVVADATAEVGAKPSAHVPAGPPFFRFADEAEFHRLLADAGLSDVMVQTVAYAHHFPSVDAYWDVMIDATVRTRGLVLGQPESIRSRIRSAVDRLADEYATGDGLDIPVSLKLASGVKVSMLATDSAGERR